MLIHRYDFYQYLVLEKIWKDSELRKKMKLRRTDFTSMTLPLKTGLQVTES